MLPDLRIGFSGGRSGGLVVPSLSEFSTVYCDPHSQRLWCNKAEVDVFLELSCIFDDPADVGNLISAFSAFFKTSLNIWKLMVYILLKSGLGNFKHYFTSVWDECNCVVASYWIWNLEVWVFQLNSPFARLFWLFWVSWISIWFLGSACQFL